MSFRSHTMLSAGGRNNYFDGQETLPDCVAIKNWTNDHREWYRTVYLKSDHWFDLRRRKLTANPKCERCEETDRLEPHHLNYRNLFDVQLEDLETLCRGCHSEEHEVNGLPRRARISYERYLPPVAIAKINSQSDLEREMSELLEYAFNPTDFGDWSGDKQKSYWHIRRRSFKRKRIGMSLARFCFPHWFNSKTGSFIGNPLRKRGNGNK